MASTLDELLGPLFPEVPELQNTENAYDLMNHAESILQNPRLLGSQINQLTQPLSNALVSNITNQVNPQIAMRGLATSPSMSQYILAQALAPADLKEQENAGAEAINGLTYMEPTYYPSNSFLSEAGLLGSGIGSGGSSSPTINISNPGSVSIPPGSSTSGTGGGLLSDLGNWFESLF